MTDKPDVTVRPTDLSAYEVFRVSATLGNHVTIAVKSTLVESCRIDGFPRWSIHLMLWGDFGPWEHYWSHCGSTDGGWWNWLESTDRSYWMKKMVGDDDEFDSKRSLAAAHKMLEDYRHEMEGEIPNDDNFKPYPELLTAFRDHLRENHEKLREAAGCDETTFYHVHQSLTYLTFKFAMRGMSTWVAPRDKLWAYDQNERAYCQDGDVSVYHRPKPRLVWFWENVWRPFIEQAKATQGFRQQVAA